MGIVCPSCDVEPSSDATSGAPCPRCGTRLVVVDERDKLLGSVIDGRFEILGRLGAGGMGVVYRARQRSIDREIALKVLDHRVEQDASSVKRFFREAKLASTLTHPNTIAIIDFGQGDNGRLYLAMELVRGHNLLEELDARGAMPLPRIVAIGIQLCDALEVAHGLSIVHRDLKLENVMLVDGGRDHIKVLDFGLALSLTDPNGRATATGLVSGTPRYMPPEVALDGAAPAPAQDMYAVGVILGELALGRALWTAPTLLALFTQKLEVEAAVENVPASLRPLVRSLLDAQPGLRPSAAQVRASLLRLDPSRRSPSTSPPAVAAVAAAAAAAAPTTDLKFPDMISLVALDERDASTQPTITSMQASPAAKSSASPPRPTLPDTADPRFAPPGTAGGPMEPVLELEVESRPLPVSSPAPRKRRQLGPLFAVLLIAAAGGGVVVVVNRKPTQAASKNRAPLIELTITARSPVDVEVDGRHVGKTPVTLNVPSSRTLMMVRGGSVLKQITPDHDQTVELATR